MEKILIEVENWTIEQQTGYTPITSFYTDFSMADNIGTEAVRNTFDRCFEEWKNNYKYMTELCLALNWKLWRWYQRNDELAKVYDSLWKKVDNWCTENLKGEELDYFYQVTD